MKITLSTTALFCVALAVILIVLLIIYSKVLKTRTQKMTGFTLAKVIYPSEEYPPLDGRRQALVYQVKGNRKLYIPSAIYEVNGKSYSKLLRAATFSEDVLNKAEAAGMHWDRSQEEVWTYTVHNESKAARNSNLLQTKEQADEERLQNTRATIKLGSEVPLHYNPDRPTQSYIFAEKGEWSCLAYLLAILAILLFPLSLILFVIQSFL